MKRLALVILSVLLCLSMVACSNDTATKEPVDQVTTKKSASTTATISSTTASTTRGPLTTTTWSGKGTAPEFFSLLLTADEETGLQVALTHGEDDTFSPVKEGAEMAQTVGQKNYYWDSWVDLYDNNRYGAWNMQFQLAALSLSDGKLTEGLMQYPTYGADGRVNGLFSTITAVYSKETFVPGDRYGLRAVGALQESRFEIYGWVMDLAFRSQHDGALTLDAAEDSYLYLYSPSEEVSRALAYMQIVFFDTETREVLARAKFDPSCTTEVKDAKGRYGCTAISVRLVNDEDAFVVDGEIADLTAGQTRRVSALMYLDGEKVTNADVMMGAILWRGLLLHFSATSE